MLTLISIGSSFVPHLSVTVALGLTAIDLGVLIYFIHHIATAIQLPGVIASIAHDLGRAIDAEAAPGPASGATAAGLPLNGSAPVNGPSAKVLLDRAGRVVTAPTSGYLRFIWHATLVRIAAEHDAVIRLHYRSRKHRAAPARRVNGLGRVRFQVASPGLGRVLGCDRGSSGRRPRKADRFARYAPVSRCCGPGVSVIAGHQGRISPILTRSNLAGAL